MPAIEMASPESAAQAGLFLGLGWLQAGRAAVVPGREACQEIKSQSNQEEKELGITEFGFLGVSHFPTNWLCCGGTQCAPCCRDGHGDYRLGLLILEEI